MLAVFVLLPTGFRSISSGVVAAAVVESMLFALAMIVTQRLTIWMPVRTLPLARELRARGSGNARLLRRIAVVTSAMTASQGAISAKVLVFARVFAYWIFIAPSSPFSLGSSAAVAPAAALVASTCCIEKSINV